MTVDVSGSWELPPAVQLGVVDFHQPQRRSAQDAQRVEQERNNRARSATSEHQLQLSGLGQRRVEEPVMFEVTFIREPHLSTGFALVSNPSPRMYQDPYGFVGVRAWVTNERGHYTGAWVYARVEADLVDTAAIPTTTPKMKTVAFLSFSGLAYKDPGVDGVTESFTVTVREVDI